MSTKERRYEARPAPDPPGPWCVWDLHEDKRVPKADKIQPMSFTTKEEAEKTANGMDFLLWLTRSPAP